MWETQNTDLWVTPNPQTGRNRKWHWNWCGLTKLHHLCKETGTGELSAAPQEYWEHSCYWKPCCHFNKPIFVAWTSCSAQSCCCSQSQAGYRAVHSGWRVPACELRLTAPEESVWETAIALSLPRKSWWKHRNTHYCLPWRKPATKTWVGTSAR